MISNGAGWMCSIVSRPPVKLSPIGRRSATVFVVALLQQKHRGEVTGLTREHQADYNRGLGLIPLRSHLPRSPQIVRMLPGFRAALREGRDSVLNRLPRRQAKAPVS